MNPQRKLMIAPIQLPTEIQNELDKFHSLCLIHEEILKTAHNSGKLSQLEKSKKMSNEARKAGNDLYTKKRHDLHIHKDILNQYSKSIAFAPKDTEELVLGYSNRSILLMHLNFYEESLVDIEKALKLSKNDMFKTKLQTRKDKCLQLIHEQNLTKSTKNLSLGDSEDPANLASKLKNFKPSVTVPCASDCVGLAYSETFGRHLVATRDIEPGEILIAEKGSVCYPLPSQMYLVCSHCLEIAWNGIPCGQCVFAMYCSEACKSEAFNEYHDIECPMVKYMCFTTFKHEEQGWDRMTSVRLFIKALRNEGFENIIKEVFKNRNEENLDGLLTNGILQSGKFKSCYNLLSHVKTLEKEDEFFEFHTSLVLYLLIEHTNFMDSFGKESSDKSAKNFLRPYECGYVIDPYVFLKFKEVLTSLKHIIAHNQYLFETISLKCSCNALYGTHKNCNLERGSIIVPCCSLINHSCTSNVSHISVPKGKVVVFSTCPIQKGEQLCDSYRGISILNGNLKARKDRFTNFACNCKACVDKIDMTKVLGNYNEDLTKILVDYEKNFPISVTNLLLQNSFENQEMSEKVLHYMINFSRLFYKHFKYYEAYKHNQISQIYIKKMMSNLFKEKLSIPHNC